MKSRVLPIIAGSFGLVCVLQLTTLSLANAGEDVAIADETTIKDVQPENTDYSTATTPQIDDENVCVSSALADALLLEQIRLDEKGLKIAKREKALTALEAKLDEQLASLNETKDVVQSQLDRIEQIASSDLEHLISMYETMKPKKAAEIFDSMAPGFAAGFLRDMNSANAGLIMSEMDAKKSYEISLVIANRNAALRTPQ
jgi:flagellar motility protein MotE (MotC chaperone)